MTGNTTSASQIESVIHRRQSGKKKKKKKNNGRPAPHNQRTVQYPLVRCPSGPVPQVELADRFGWSSVWVCAWRGRATIQFEEVCLFSLDAPKKFWSEAAAAIDWVDPCPFSTILGRPSYWWFAGRSPEHLLHFVRPSRRGRRGRSVSRPDSYDSPGQRRWLSRSPTVSSRAGSHALPELSAVHGVERGLPLDRVHAGCFPRWCMVMLACARLRSDPLGGVRRALRRDELASPDRRCQNPRSSLRPRGGIEPGRVVSVRASPQRGDRSGQKSRA